ncbi:MAG: hypothetical protein HQM08_29020 [Candidatus Riflebacteria bacterium]|nr:hypothetical protein [Candidatus Riflebacteria bacterium]
MIWQKQAVSDASPTVSIMQLTNGASFLYGKDILITSVAQDPVGQVSRVDIYTDGKLLSSICSTPYTCVWLKPSAGSHQISAVTFNSSGQFTLTAPINVTVNSPSKPDFPENLQLCRILLDFISISYKKS